MSESAVTPEWKRWVEAGKVLAADPTAQVPCPRHGDGILAVEDVPDPANPALAERYLRCPVCGTSDVIRNPRG